MPRLLRLALVLAAAVTPSAGCFRAYNPTYFPNWGFGGDLIRTHAKPTGGAYFRNYDPKAVRVEVTPTQQSARPGTQQVLVATVYDKDGDARRSRRVEWMIDGPGFIVEVDESGWWAGRGYKVDNKYAVSHTDYKEHCVTRGNDDPRDDFTVHPGQTWCVVSSAVEGLTTVTAYAPEVYDWDCGRVTAKIQWADTQFSFPPPVLSRFGGEIDLTTSVRRLDGKESPDGLRVRYRVLDGPAATVVSRTAGASVSRSGAGDREAEVTADADGKATVKVVQAGALAGKTRVSVEVVKPDPSGTGPGTVVGQQVTTVEWAAPDLKLEVIPPAGAGAGRDAVVSVVASNPGKADSAPVTLRVPLPDRAELVSADPPSVSADRFDSRDLRWSLGSIPAGGSQTVKLTLRPAKTGPLALTASADTTDGLRASHKATLDVGTSALKLTADAPAAVGVGERFTLTVGVANPGTSAAEHVTAWVTIDGPPTEVPVGLVPPGETKKVDVPLTANTAGKLPVKVTATADGGLTEKAETTVEAKRSSATVVVAGPAELTFGETGTWEIRLTNTGDGPLTATARASLPAGLAARGPTEWPVNALAPGAKTVLKLTAASDKPIDRGVIAVTVSPGERRGSTPPSALASGDASVTVAGKPALILELADPPGVVPVGKRGEVRITVRNRGTGPARGVEVTAAVSDALTPVGGTGADQRPAAVDARSVRFGVLDELPAGKAAVFVAELEAAKPGAARLQVEVRAEHLSQPLRDEQAARVVSGK